MDKRMHVARPFVILVAIMATILGAATSAAAAAPKFFSATSTVSGTGALVVSFDERGLGNENIDYTLTADATALYACINGGNKHPQAANKESFPGDVAGGGSFEAKNGRVIANLTAGPISAGAFTCPSGQRLVLASVTYTNIVLTDTTNSVSTSVADASRTFFTV
ncbi:hypothetical protein [Pengzhenrongella sp.]|jgi:hypothetical protein|uniref:hypothetical protein n=1 Tax=Pengzhenrongella sp. TaxID=2888820 RepID=UPI002F9503A7